MILFNYPRLAQPLQSLVYGVFFADATFPRDRLSRRKCNARAAVTVLAETTVDGYIARLEIVRKDVVVDAEKGVVHGVSLFPIPHFADLGMMCYRDIFTQ